MHRRGAERARGDTQRPQRPVGQGRPIAAGGDDGDDAGDQAPDPGHAGRANEQVGHPQEQVGGRERLQGVGGGGLGSQQRADETAEDRAHHDQAGSGQQPATLGGEAQRRPLQIAEVAGAHRVEEHARGGEQAQGRGGPKRSALARDRSQQRPRYDEDR